MTTKEIPAIRRIWAELRDEVDGYSLCSFCRLGRPEGSACGEDYYVECLHPIDAISERVSEDAQFGSDCWGFRSKYDYDTTIDIIGACVTKPRAWHLVKPAANPAPSAQDSAQEAGR